MIKPSQSSTFGVVAGTILVLAAFGVSWAGPNAGGVLILSAHPEVVVCSDNESYCPDLLLDDCEAANTTHSGRETILFGVYAAFSGSPRVSGVTIGIEYDPAIAILSFGNCGDFELPLGDWPASGSGTAVTWSEAQTSQIQPMYWFVGYEYYQVGGTFSLVPHPTGGSVFADDSIPAVIDVVAAFGALGFNGAVGSLTCPGVPETGACCLPDCSCVVVTRDECEGMGGGFAGPGSTCDEVLCLCEGACCFVDGTCAIRIEPDCVDEDGTFQGIDSICEPNPCDPIPVHISTWGEIKALYW